MDNPYVKPLLTKLEAAKVLGVSLNTVHRLIQAGELKATRFGKLVRVSAEAIEDFIKKGGAI